MPSIDSVQEDMGHVFPVKHHPPANTNFKHFYDKNSCQVGWECVSLISPSGSGLLGAPSGARSIADGTVKIPR